MNYRRQRLESFRKTVSTNSGLWLDKYFGQGNGDNNSDDVQLKQKLVKEVAESETPDIYRQFFWRWKQSLTDLKAEMRVIKISGRVIVGLGAEGVLETSIYLHRTYGVPVIRGSSLKGLAAAYARQNLNNWARTDPAYKTIFGSHESAGYITFHDALPVPANIKPLAADVLTVHHRDYYGEVKDGRGNILPPADWDNPVPIPLLSATGDYLLALSGIAGTQNWILRAFDIIDLALKEIGVGAKSSSGYGRGFLSNEIPLSETEKETRQQQNQNTQFEKWLGDIKTATAQNELDKKTCKELEKKLRDFAPQQIKQGAKEFLSLIGDERGAKLTANKSEWYAKIVKAAAD